MKLKLPEKAEFIICELERAGFEAFAVGGCVRDMVLGRIPTDWDITTNATPPQIKQIFKRTIDTGIRHGTVTVMLGNEGFEVTTYRIDGEYEDFRHPSEVIFTANLGDDLKRRDFTINAMAYNESRGLVDLFEGMEDLKKRTIRCVGNPCERFGEDALRMLRAVRFSAQLGFEIDESTKQAIKALASTLQKISSERIQTELVKLITSPNPDFLKTAYELGITGVFFPELDEAFLTPQNHPHHMYNVGEHLMHCMKNIRNDKTLRLAALLHDIGKPAARTTDAEGIDHFYGHPEIGVELSVNILRRLKFDNDTIKKVRTYVRYHDIRLEPDIMQVRKALNKMGAENFAPILELKRADTLAQSLYMREEKLEYIKSLSALYDEIMSEKQCVSLKTLAIGGNDLISLGAPRGKRIGELLNILLEDVIENPQNNNAEYLMSYARQLISHMT